MTDLVLSKWQKVTKVNQTHEGKHRHSGESFIQTSPFSVQHVLRFLSSVTMLRWLEHRRRHCYPAATETQAIPLWSEPSRQGVPSLQILLTGARRSTIAKWVPRNASSRCFPILCTKPWENSFFLLHGCKVVGWHPQARYLHPVTLNRGCPSEQRPM